MQWLFYAVLCTVLFTVYNILNKLVVKESSADYIAHLTMILYSFVNLPLILIFQDLIKVNIKSLFGLTLAGLLFAVAGILYMRSLKHGRLSDTVPLLSFTPIITLVVAYVIVKEMPGVVGVIGIMLIIIGAYLLHVKELSGHHILRPLSVLFKFKGSRYMLMVAFLYGFGATIDKYVIIHSNILTRVLLISYFTLAFQLPYLLFKDKQNYFVRLKQIFKSKFWPVLGITIIFLAMIGAQMIAITKTYVAYVTALKRTAALFTVIAAYIFFNEKDNFKQTLTGTLLLVSGAVLLMF